MNLGVPQFWKHPYLGRFKSVPQANIKSCSNEFFSRHYSKVIGSLWLSQLIIELIFIYKIYYAKQIDTYDIMTYDLSMCHEYISCVHSCTVFVYMDLQIRWNNHRCVRERERETPAQVVHPKKCFCSIWRMSTDIMRYLCTHNFHQGVEGARGLQKQCFGSWREHLTA